MKSRCRELSIFERVALFSLVALLAGAPLMPMPVARANAELDRTYALDFNLATMAAG